MPNCFQLIDKITNEPARFNDVDDQMCAALNVPVHPKKYYLDWYDLIGFRLALGRTWDEIEIECKEYEDVQLLRVIEWLRSKYNTNAWAERR